MQNFHGKVVVITGGGSGIGRALAAAFAEEGAKLTIADIDANALDTVEQELSALGADVLAVRTDVSDRGSVGALAAKTVERFGSVHVLCNNAGVGQSLRPVWDFSAEYWQWSLGVNLWGVINGISTFVPLMLRQECEAHIVNTSSVAGLLSYPFPLLGPYAAAKHAVVSISETLAADLAQVNQKIKVSVLAPGFVRTQIANSERLRPAHIATEGHVDPSLESMWKAAIESGTDPSVIAKLVLNAIREERLYVLPHRDFDEAIRAHVEDLIQQRTPVTPTADVASAGSASGRV